MGEASSVRLDTYKRTDRGERVYTLTINENELERMDLSPLDRLVLDEVRLVSDVTIADQLLALELVARRIEEAGGAVV